MKVSYDPAKRAATLASRGLDFAEAGEVFSGRHASLQDDRRDYGEVRFTTAGYLAGRLAIWLAGWLWWSGRPVMARDGLFR